jgi:hypothetical protein
VADFFRFLVVKNILGVAVEVALDDDDIHDCI